MSDLCHSIESKHNYLMFSYLYNKVISWAEHRRAPTYLFGLTFCESIFFPIPTDIMLAPMSAVQPRRAIYFAWWTTVFSVLGGVGGFLIGYFAFQQIEPYLVDSWRAHYDAAKAMFDEWGGIAVVIAAVTPIPYKVFTITAGTLSQNIMVFIVASFVGRGARFFLVALLSAALGQPALKMIEKRIEFWGWVSVGVIAVAGLIYYFMF